MITQFYYLRRAEIAWDGEEEEEGESAFSAKKGGKEEKGMTEKKEIRTILGEQKGQCGTRSWKQDGNSWEGATDAAGAKGLGEYEKKKSKDKQETASFKDSEKGKGITAGKASEKSEKRNEMESEKRKSRESVVEVKRGGEGEFKRGREADKWMASGTQFTCFTSIKVQTLTLKALQEV